MIIPEHEADCWACKGTGKAGMDKPMGTACMHCGGTGKHRIPEMVSAVTLTKEEYEHAQAWLEEHKKFCSWASGRRYAGAIGGVISWIGVDTSIGQAVSVRCACGAEHFCSENL